MESVLFQAVTLATAVAIDLLWGEPPAAMHPVVWMGKWIAALERRAPARPEAARFLYGVSMVGVSVAVFAGPAALLERALRSPMRCTGPRSFAGACPTGVIALGLCLKPAFSVHMLLDATERVAAALERDDLPGAREALRSLVSRDTSALPPPLLAAAAIESVTENLGDSVVAPLLAFALLGLPGAIGYRVVNTLDAMIGYHSPQYEYLGKAAARLDDALNFIPARVSGLLLALAAPTVGGRVTTPRGFPAGMVDAWRVMRRDHRITASPNAGWPMSAAAGALGVTLEKVGHYRLNPAGRPPTAADVRRAITLTRSGLALGGATLIGCYVLRAWLARPQRLALWERPRAARVRGIQSPL